MTLTFSNVSVRYGRRIAVEGVTLDVRPGEMLALVGPNGSGKSSLLKAAAGVISHDGRINRPGDPGVERAIGYMPQDTASQAALTALEAVLLGRHHRLGLVLSDGDLRKAQEALEELGVGALSGRRLGELSGGQRQLVFLAQAVVGDPQVLLLDEPISALDIHHQLHVLSAVRRLTADRDLTTIVVLHDLAAAARQADRVAVLDRGRLVGVGAPSDILSVDLIRAVFHVEAAIVAAPDAKPLIAALRCVGPVEAID